MSWALTWRSNPAYKALQKCEDSLIETLSNWKIACVAGVRKGTCSKRRTRFIRTPSIALRASRASKSSFPFLFRMPSTETYWKIPTDTYKGSRPNPCCSQVVWKRINKNNIISTLVFSHNRVSLILCLDSTRNANVPFFRPRSKSAPSRSFCDPSPSTLPAIRSKSTFPTTRALLPLYPCTCCILTCSACKWSKLRHQPWKQQQLQKLQYFRKKTATASRSRTFARHFLF